MDDWYLVYCKPRQEQRAQQQLLNQGFDSFVPMITVNVLRAGKKIQRTEPLFPRYLFLKSQAELNITAIRSTRGVAALVRFGDSLARIPSALVQSLLTQQLHLQQQLTAQQPFMPGDTIQILSGPFASLNAIFELADGDSRSLVLLTFLGQQLRLTLDNQQLAKTK
ncbi:transcription/translation regulatory transformer protein RfaH [Arsukibacterium sp.]|uniref:transcription/translation regulatory transformer protein RfaH n=1 Tax=Arsukibacterium sp. TaxID=1977258 RepID=UPI002FDAA381